MYWMGIISDCLFRRMQRRIKQDRDKRFAVKNLSGMDQPDDLRERSHQNFDALIVLRRCLAQSEIFGKKNIHRFRQEAWAGEVADVVRPRFCAVAGFFDELAFGGGDKLFARFDASGGELEEE